MKIEIGVEKVIVLYGWIFIDFVILNWCSIKLIRLKVLWSVMNVYKLFNWY